MINKQILCDNLTLYLVTDRDMLCGTSLLDAIESAVKGGVTIVQLREKNSTLEDFIKIGKAVKNMLDNYNIPLIINDNIDVCIAVNADGVHLGSTDGSIKNARERLGADKIIGASARTVEGAKALEAEGADYLGVGAVFGTSTKLDAKTISEIILKDITSSVSIPVVAIGGVNADNICKLKGCGVFGVAVISAILKTDDIACAALAIKKLALSIK